MTATAQPLTDFRQNSKLVCLMCGLENAPEAVFCANEACGKALGAFRYVTEEMEAEAIWHESLAEKVTEFIAKPHFFVMHGLWIGLWILLNTGVLAIMTRFDGYPFSLLALLVGVEAIFISGFVLIRQNRQNQHSAKRAELDYEVSVQTYRRIVELETMLQRIHTHLVRLESENRLLRREATARSENP